MSGSLKSDSGLIQPDPQLTDYMIHAFEIVMRAELVRKIEN